MLLVVLFKNKKRTQEKELRAAGVPIPSDFKGGKKSYTLHPPPADAETLSQIGVLSGAQLALYDFAFQHLPKFCKGGVRIAFMSLGL